MSLVDRFSSFFKDDEKELDDALYERSSEILSWVQHPQHARFEQWLEDEASRPIPIGPNTLEYAVRVNTLREIQQHLRRIKAQAEDSVRRIREEA